MWQAWTRRGGRDAGSSRWPILQAAPSRPCWQWSGTTVSSSRRARPTGSPAVPRGARVLYAGVNGYLDQIPTEDVSRFQDELREHLRADGSIYTAIRDSGDLSDEVAEQLNAEIDKVKSRFQTSTDQEAA